MDGAPAAPDWGNRHRVVCGRCESDAVNIVVGYVAQRMSRLGPLRLLVPSDGAVEWGAEPDLVELSIQPGDWTLWPVCRVGWHPSGDRLAALPAAPLQWVHCRRCGDRVRLDLQDLRRGLPSGRALVA